MALGISRSQSFPRRCVVLDIGFLLLQLSFTRPCDSFSLGGRAIVRRFDDINGPKRLQYNSSFY